MSASNQCKGRIWRQIVIILIIITSCLYLIHLNYYQLSDINDDKQRINFLSVIDICHQYNNIKEINTLSQYLNSTLSEIMQYLSKLYCPIITSNPKQYIDDLQSIKQIEIAHVLNMYDAKINDYSYLYFAAPITFLSMLKAKRYAMEKLPNISVGLYSSNYIEDNKVIPIFINKLPNLNRSLQDTIWAKNGTLSNAKKLPFISDIIDSLYENVDSKYIIYTNADIGVQKNFYVKIWKMLTKNRKLNGLSITRRQILYVNENNNEPLTFLSMNEIYRQGLNNISSKRHGGHDCFVFNRSLWGNEEIKMKNIFLGYPRIGMTFARQLQAIKRTRIIKNEYLTFHLGMTNKVTKWITSNGWRNKENSSVKFTDDHYQHERLNKLFCKMIEDEMGV